MGFIGSIQGSRGKLAGALGDALGKGLGEVTGSYFANQSLDNIINDPKYANATQPEKFKALQEGLGKYGKRGQDLLARRLEMEQKEEGKLQQQVFSKALEGEATPEELAKLPFEQRLKVNERRKSKELGGRIKQALLDRGMPEDLADYYGQAIESTEKGTGQSYVIKDALEAANRFGTEQNGSPFQESIGSGKKSSINPEFEFPLPEKEQGLNPKERAARKDKYAQENMKLSNENRTVRRGIKEDQANFKKLENLNPLISEGFSKVNINPLTGDPIFPAAASPEERQYVKILVHQLRNAKDTFGARITDFDAKKYLEGFPSLADNPESRLAVIKDLQKVNEINRIYANALDEVYRTYKPDEISPSQAEQIAEDISAPQIDKLWEQYQQANESEQKFNQEPPAAKFKGRKIQSPDGNVYISDGNQWVPVR